MPAKAPPVTMNLKKTLRQLGQEIRDRRKKLGVRAVAAAEAAGMSRITLYRIERGEASVAMGAYLSAVTALGLSLKLEDPEKPLRRDRAALKLPKRIRWADYKQLKRLAWQLKDTQEITPQEALDLYERNWRHIDAQAMDAKERKFLEKLQAAFGRERLLV